MLAAGAHTVICLLAAGARSLAPRLIACYWCLLELFLVGDAGVCSSCACLLAAGTRAVFYLLSRCDCLFATGACSRCALLDSCCWCSLAMCLLV